MCFSETDGQGYVDDGREIFDDVDEYETQANSKKRKGQNKSKLPNEPVSKKKSLKNFFKNQVSKEKETSVEDDNLLKNMLGELNNSTENGSSSINGDLIAPKMIRRGQSEVNPPKKSIRKQATEEDIAMKKYIERLGQKAQETKKKSDIKADVRFMTTHLSFLSQLAFFKQDILENLLKEERKAKAKDDKENLKSLTNSIVPEEIKELPLITSLPHAKDLKREQEEKELLEISLLDDLDDFPIQQTEKVEKAVVKTEPEPSPPKKTVPDIKTMTSKPLNMESMIFSELQGIDFDTEIREEIESKIDWNQVSSLPIDVVIEMLIISV